MSNMRIYGDFDFFCLKNVLYFCNSNGMDKDNSKTIKNSLQSK